MPKITRVQFLLTGLLAVAFTGCAPVSNGPNRNPVISSFTLKPVAAMNAQFEMEINDPDGDELKCTVNDGVDVTIFTGEYCASTTSKAYNLVVYFKQAGTYTATLKLEDGRGGIAIATTKVTVK